MREETEHPAFKLATLALAQGQRDIVKRPGPTHVEVDEHWDVWVNPHDEENPHPKGGTIPPHSFFVEWNGWPASIFHPLDERIMFVGGELANIDTFLEAVDAAIERAKERT